MDNANTIAQADAQEGGDSTVKVSLNIPTPLWKDVKKAAIDADQTAQQFVIDTIADRLRSRKVRRAS